MSPWQFTFNAAKIRFIFSKVQLFSVKAFFCSCCKKYFLSQFLIAKFNVKGTLHKKTFRKSLNFNFLLNNVNGLQLSKK